MPAYIAADPYVAAQNGEDAVVEYLLLGFVDGSPRRSPQRLIVKPTTTILRW